mmetsp:Transcript_5585/g.5098  ORF Transcript_5585/g.5098 Transcript_5585/m.5098 type:complete len:115 (-) Transcript_5585:881-1225(-)
MIERLASKRRNDKSRFTTERSLLETRRHACQKIISSLKHSSQNSFVFKTRSTHDNSSFEQQPPLQLNTMTRSKEASQPIVSNRMTNESLLTTKEKLEAFSNNERFHHYQEAPGG